MRDDRRIPAPAPRIAPPSPRSQARHSASAFALAAVLGALAVAWPAPALADPTGAAAAGETVISANIVSIDGTDLFVDLPASTGASAGDVVELWRRLRIKHPVTGRTLEDRFRIGSIRITQVGQVVSLAKAEGELQREPAPGDIVLVRHAASVAPPAPAPERRRTPPPAALQPHEPPAPAAPAPAADPEVAELTAIFDGLRGSDPVARIRAYEDYVRRRPEGRYAVVLYEEAQNLRRMLADESAAPATRTAEGRASEPERPRVVHFVPPEEAMAESPLSLGAELGGPVRGAVLHVRNAGEVAYKSEPMQLVGPGYYAVTVPADQVRPGRLEFFLEATGPDGAAVPIHGQAENPVSTVIHEVPKPEPPAHRKATATLLTDYANYNNMKSNDYAWQTEGTFGLRYDEIGVRAFRSGFGVYRGAGGTIDDIDVAHKRPRLIGLTYGYLELELGASDFVSVLGRAVVGLRDEGISGGAQGAIRIGNDQKTNLLLGGEFLGGVGMRGFTQLELNTFERFPITIRSEVTNQPAGVSDSTPRASSTDAGEEVSSDKTEVGARGIVQVGYRVIPPLVVAVRGSYQGRTINHAGPGLGAALTYSW